MRVSTRELAGRSLSGTSGSTAVETDAGREASVELWSAEEKFA
jgi:hypothetical protein